MARQALMGSATDSSSPWAAAPPLLADHQPRVDFMFVGVQKAGSSWLHQALSLHPELILGRGEDDKDTCFFSYRYDRGYQWYEKHFATPQAAKLTGEVSTSYFPCRDAPERIARYNPNMKLLLCLRNPVDRLISHHFHEIRLGHIAPGSLADGISNNPSYLDQSRYHTWLVRWLEHFPLSSFHIVIFEVLFADPGAHLERIHRFLGVAPQRMFPREKINERRIPVSRTVDAVTRGSSAMLKSVGLGGAIAAVKRSGLQRMVSRTNARTDHESFVDDDLRDALYDHFLDENQKLATLVDIRLDLWRRHGDSTGD